MINGAHSIIYSQKPEVDRAFLRDVLRLPNVDVGQGWLIFGLPPAEVAVHPSEKNDLHEFYLMSDDVNAFIAEMKAHNIACGPVRDEGWGLLTHVTLPGGGRLGVYEPQQTTIAAADSHRAIAQSLTATALRPRMRRPPSPA